MKKRSKRVSLIPLFGIVILLLSAAPGDLLSASAQGMGGDNSHDIQKVEPHIYGGDVRSLPAVPSKPTMDRELNEPESNKPSITAPQMLSPTLTTASMPAPSRNFAGMSRNGACGGVTCGAGIPPDTNGEVGFNYYIQSVNSSFAIYSKTGARLAAFSEAALWAGSGKGQCDGNSQGDPVVLYDPMANRWILTDMAFPFSGGNPVSPYYICIAVSKTSDPVSGGWYLYAVRTDTGLSGQPPVGTMDDYPKFGIWTDCLYFSANGFNSAGNYIGGMFGSFSRSDMYAGKPLTGALGFKSNSNDYFTMIPSNLGAPGSTGLPPAGTPNYYVQESLTSYGFLVRKFTAGPNCSGGTLGSATSVSQTGYTIPNGDIVPQPSPATSSNKLDSLSDRIMQKVQYRKVGSRESLWVSHTFRSSSSGATGVQWAQINVTGRNISTTPVQQQLYNPGDGNYRWMSSIAADRNGDAAIGYSISGPSTYPAIAYAGRLVSDPLNTLPQGEKRLVAGAGSQTNNCGGAPCHRWGDYSSLSVDPADGCTFWFTSEYYTSQTAGSSGAWDTRIGSFAFPSCTSTPTITKTLYSTASLDGWTLESGAGTGDGGSLNSTATSLRVGDDAANRQYRSILSFDTSGVPASAVITSVTLKFNQQGITGGNPFNTMGNIVVDMRKGAFNGNPALESVDFQAPATYSGAMTITNSPVSGWYTKSLGSSYFAGINRYGNTQFRLRFATPSNKNLAANGLSFYSGDFTTTPSLRPTLIIKYYVP